MKPTSSEKMTITVKKAGEWRAHIDPDHQRKYTAKHAKHLASIIERGEFLTGHIVFARVNGKVRCANGQHTLQAVIMAKQPISAFVEWYDCSDEKDYIGLYHSFDTENKKRTSKDSAEAFLRGLRHLFPNGATSYLLNLFRAGLEASNSMSFNATPHDVTQYIRFENVTRFYDEFELVIQLNGQRVDDKLLHRVPVVAAIVVGCAADMELCRSFWRQVVTGFFDVQEVGHPPFTLHNWLRKMEQMGGNVTSKNGISRKEMFMGCLRTWQAFVDGRRLKLIRPIVKRKKRAG